MIRGLDIPRGRLATLWPLQRTNQARAFDADAEAGSHVAQNEGQEEEVEGLEHAARPVADPDSGAPRGFDRRRSGTDETIGRPTVTEPMSKPMEPYWRTRGPAGASNDGRRVLAGVLRWPVPRTLLRRAMRNPERSALLKVSGLLGSTVVAMGLGLSSACAQKNPIIEYNQPSAPLQTKAPFTGAGPAASVSAGAPSEAQPGQSFEQWRDAFRQQALAGGIDAQTFDRAFAGVEPDPAVVEADRSQPEFTRPVWKYLEGALDPLRVRQGQARLAQHARILGEVDARYAVDADAVVAIWGMESNYGSHMGNKNVIRSLATLAYEGRRPEFAHAQLLAALKILQHGDVPASFMIGSWAGAMGQTQFIPTTYNQYAVDFDGDGKRDIWGSPGDALASTANYLKASGWIAGQPWGSKSACRQASTIPWRNSPSASPWASGKGWAYKASTAAPCPPGSPANRPRCCCRPGTAARPSWCCTTSAPSSSTTTPVPMPWPSACSPTASRAAAG